MTSPLSSLIILLSLGAFTHALPVALLPNAPTSPLVFPLSVVPLLLLAILKYTYIRYRRDLTTSDIDKNKPSAAVTCGVGVRFCRRIKLKIGLVQTGYLVGFLGSPEWETRMKCGAPKATRKSRTRVTSKPSSSLLYSRILGDSSKSSGNDTSYHTTHCNHSQPRSRCASVSYLDLRSPEPHVDITSCASVHPSSPACNLSTPELPFPPTAYFPSRSVHASPEIPSPTLMQIMEPVLSSWYDDARARDLERSQDNSKSSGEASSQQQSRNRSQSPTPPFETPPTSPRSQSPPLYVNVIRPQLTMSTSSSRRSVGGIDSLTVSVYETSPSIAVPPPTLTPKIRPRSWDVLSGEWQGQDARTSVQSDQFMLQSPTHRSPSTPPSMYHLAVSAARAPFSTTTRPLNVSAKRQSLSPPTTPSFESLSPLEIVTGKIRQSSKRPSLQRRRSGSPHIGPSPLRNTLLVETSMSLPTMDLSRTNSVAPSVSGTWELEDLVRNGQLDVDAVSAVLGLGLTSLEDSDERLGNPAPSSEPELCHSPDHSVPDHFAGMGWGRACESGMTTLQMRVPGEQLSAIMEETDEVDSIEESVRHSASAGSLRGAGPQYSGLSLDKLIEASCGASIAESDIDSCYEADRTSVWTDERSWRESPPVQESIGLAW